MGYILGIDPGLTGGLSFLDYSVPFCSPKQSFVYHTPVITTKFVKQGKKKTRNNMDLNEARKIIKKYNVDIAYLEEVHAMPGQGVTGMFRFGQNFGQWEGILAGLEIDVIKVPPQTWKSRMKLRSAAKTLAREMATEYFPLHEDSFRKVKDDGVAESILIALYGCYNQKYVPDIGPHEAPMKIII